MEWTVRSTGANAIEIARARIGANREHTLTGRARHNPGAACCHLLCDEFDADVDASTSRGATPLLLAASAGHGHTCRVLLDAGASANRAQGGTGLSALQAAACAGHAHSVGLLLSRGAWANYVDAHGCTALWLAAAHGWADVVWPWALQ